MGIGLAAWDDKQGAKDCVPSALGLQQRTTVIVVSGHHGTPF